MESGVVEPILTQKKYQSLYGTIIPILYKVDEKFVANIHIYGDRAIFLLFCNHQDTESES